MNPVASSIRSKIAEIRRVLYVGSQEAPRKSLVWRGKLGARERRREDKLKIALTLTLHQSETRILAARQYKE